MSAWERFRTEEPELAAAVRARFAAARHHVLVTIRRDGSPGTEVDFVGEDVLLGAMTGAVRSADLRRDPRFSLHSNPGDGSMASGDARVSGRALEITDAAERRVVAAAAGASGPADLFRLHITEAVLVSITPDGEAMRIESWRPGAAPVRYERRGFAPAVRL